MRIDFMYRKLADGLFLDVCRQVSKEFPNIKFDEVLLDRACLHVSKKDIENLVVY